MTMLSLALGALAFSAVSIVILCVGDPKRRRSTGGKEGGMPPGRRLLLVAIACFPGFICAVLGDAAAFFLWLGGCALVGWALAVGMAAMLGAQIKSPRSEGLRSPDLALVRPPVEAGQHSKLASQPTIEQEPIGRM